MRIGLLDSGVGGRCLMGAVEEALPDAELIYCADQTNLPYGTKSGEQIRACVLAAARNLEVDALVLACHTASAYALETLQTELSIPVIGMVEATLREAQHHKRVGLLATASTLISGAYPPVPYARACPLFVQLAEANLTDGPLARAFAHHYLDELPPLDALILGCTHYPALHEAIREAVGPEVTLIDGIAACVEELVQHCPQPTPVPQ